MMKDDNRERAKRVIEAMLTTAKLDIAKLEQTKSANVIRLILSKHYMRFARFTGQVNGSFVLTCFTQG